MKTFEGRNAVITGAASGIGRGLALALAARGARLTLADINLAGAQAVADEIGRGGGKASAVRLDVADEAAFSRMLDTVEPLDYLFNNAGYAMLGESRDMPYADWKRLVEVNLLGVLAGSLAAYRRMARQGHGHIVNVASLAGLVHPAGMASYNAVKAAVVALTETAGHELASYGVRASVVCPSYFRTNLMTSMRGSDEAVGAVVARLVESSPLTADDIAAEVLAGIERGDAVIVPDQPARDAWALKQSDRPAYDAVMRAQAAKLEAMS